MPSDGRCPLHDVLVCLKGICYAEGVRNNAVSLAVAGFAPDRDSTMTTRSRRFSYPSTSLLGFSLVMISRSRIFMPRAARQ